MTKKKNKNEDLEILEEDLPDLIQNLINSDPSDIDVKKLEKEPAIKKLIKFFKDQDLDVEALVIKTQPKNVSLAYPNYNDYLSNQPTRDVNKWINCLQKIIENEKNGIDFVSSIRSITANWDVMETKDFLNWLKFYKEGNHLKYKKAQYWYENTTPNTTFYQNGEPGYVLPIKKEVEPDNQKLEEEQNHKQQIENHRKKIIGRLSSIEKLLTSHDGKDLVGQELESLLKSIFDLKIKIQKLQKVSRSSRTYDDLIIREANILQSKGFRKAASYMYSIAQNQAPTQAMNGDSKNPKTEDLMVSQEPGSTPNPPETQTPLTPSGAPGGLPSTGPGMPQNPPESAPNNPPQAKDAIDGFISNLNTGKITEDLSNSDDLEVYADFDINDFVSFAQENPNNIQQPQPQAQPEPDLGVNKFDEKVNSLMSTVTIKDIVNKLEDLAKIFKTREVPRQLAIVDMMLDSLGMASFFPSLSEATNKALESNNYISTRVEEIISKLRGALETHDINLKGDDSVDQIKEKLQTDIDKEKERKEQRKQQEIDQLDKKNNPTENIEMDEEIPAPPTPQAPPAPTKPVAV